MKAYNYPLIQSYHDYACDKKTALPDNTCDDLNTDDFFTAIDFTSSCVGQQYLYHLLHQDRVSEVRQYESILSKMQQDKDWRAQLQKTLALTNHTGAYYMASLFSDCILTPSRGKLFSLSICRFLPFLLTGLAFLTHQVAFICLLAVALIANLLLHYHNKKNIYQYYHSIPQLLKMLRQAEVLAKDPLCASTAPDIRQTLTELQPLKHRIRFFKLSVQMESDIAILVYCLTEVLHIFFLTEAYAVNKSLIALSSNKRLIEKTFRFVGFIDTLYSVSLLREQLPYYCLPASPASGEKLRADAIYHPLVEDAVPNDLLLQDKSFLVTGSNMSGKTCFIRAVGLNLLAAKVLNTCFARRFAMDSDTRIFSSIHNADSLQEGKSYFLQETLQIKRMIEEASRPPCLFLLDEPFKGTNTQERIAICRAVLAALAESGNTVLVSTHDIELNKFLADKYDLYYFCESIDNQQLFFDYQLKKGVSTQRNAIRILEISHYPETIVREAERFSTQAAPEVSIINS